MCSVSVVTLPMNPPFPSRTCPIPSLPPPHLHLDWQTRDWACCGAPARAEHPSRKGPDSPCHTLPGEDDFERPLSGPGNHLLAFGSSPWQQWTPALVWTWTGDCGLLLSWLASHRFYLNCHFMRSPTFYFHSCPYLLSPPSCSLFSRPPSEPRALRSTLGICELTTKCVCDDLDNNTYRAPCSVVGTL